MKHKTRATSHSLDRRAILGALPTLAAFSSAGMNAAQSLAGQTVPPARRTLSFPAERVAGEETPTGRYKHPAAITELTNGDLYLAWYGGDGEYASNTGVYGVRLPAGAASAPVASAPRSPWSKPVLLARDPFRSVGNPVIWQAPAEEGKPSLVWLFYVIRFGETWSEGRIAAKISEDGARTWSDPSLLSLERGTLVRGKPIVLKNGRFFLPAYREAGDDREFVGEETVSFGLLYDPTSRTWTRGGNIVSRLGNLQPAPAEVAPGHLIAFCRRGGGYEERPDAWMVYAESRDAGLTWSQGRELIDLFPNPNAAVDLLTLHNGHHLLVYNHSKGSRSPLSLALSADHGKTWQTGPDVGVGPREFAYPYAIQTRDRRIHLIYTTNGRKEIHRMVFREEEIADKFPSEVTLRT